MCFLGRNERSDGLWQQQKGFETMEMNNDGRYIHNEEYRDQFNLDPPEKLSSSHRSTKFKYAFPLEHLSNEHEGYPNQYKNNHKLRNEKRHRFLSLKESQWKSR